MGVEFQQWLLVRDLDWLPSTDTAARATAVLSQWGLGDRFVVTDRDDIEWDDPEYGFVTVGVAGFLHELPALPANAVIQPVGGLVQGEVVHRIVGRSWYDGVRPEDQYLQRVTLVLGHRYNVFDARETGYTDVLEPARDERGAPVDGLERHVTAYRGLDRLGLERHERPVTTRAPSREHYPSPPAVVAPVTRFAWGDGSVHPSFSGCFRSGLGLDLGKSLAAALDGPGRLPGRAFVASLEEAFRTDLVEAGHYY